MNCHLLNCHLSKFHVSNFHVSNFHVSNFSVSKFSIEISEFVIFRPVHIINIYGTFLVQNNEPECN